MNDRTTTILRNSYSFPRTYIYVFGVNMCVLCCVYVAVVLLYVVVGVCCLFVCLFGICRNACCSRCCCCCVVVRCCCSFVCLVFVVMVVVVCLLLLCVVVVVVCCCCVGVVVVVVCCCCCWCCLFVVVVLPLCICVLFCFVHTLWVHTCGLCTHIFTAKPLTDPVPIPRDATAESVSTPFSLSELSVPSDASSTTLQLPGQRNYIPKKTPMPKYK